MSEPSAPTSLPDYSAMLDALAKQQQPRGGYYRLGAVGAFLVVSVSAGLMAFPIGLASACAWWLFLAGWNLIG